ncbi:MAG: AraC family transcriptional regulator [Bradyrhizobiaceae bacterium]|nr:AraC family transcriptional regulator [Bradyrhizobiaceae bacterium]
MLTLPTQRPLHRFTLINTRSPDEFVHDLARYFGALAVDVTADPELFYARRSYIRIKNVDLVFATCTQAYRARFPSVTMVKQPFALCGAGRTTFGSNQYVLNRSEAAVLPAGVEMTHEYQAGFQSFIFRAETAALQAKLTAVAGMPITRNIEFVVPANMELPEVQRLRRLLGFMVAELDRDEEKLPAAALGEFEQMLLLAFLNANPHNYSHLLECDQPRPAPWQVRRVEDYITANWNRPITVEALASASGASARSIFKAFKEARNCSPMAFVKSIRLQHAREMLQRPEATTTVVSTAFACGFLNPGHFARDYRLAFGELPSVTLSVSKRRH